MKSTVTAFVHLYVGSFAQLSYDSLCGEYRSFPSMWFRDAFHYGKQALVFDICPGCAERLPMLELARTKL